MEPPTCCRAINWLAEETNKKVKNLSPPKLTDLFLHTLELLFAKTYIIFILEVVVYSCSCLSVYTEWTGVTTQHLHKRHTRRNETPVGEINQHLPIDLRQNLIDPWRQNEQSIVISETSVEAKDATFLLGWSDWLVLLPQSWPEQTRVVRDTGSTGTSASLIVRTASTKIALRNVGALAWLDYSDVGVASLMGVAYLVCHRQQLLCCWFSATWTDER